MLRLLRGLFLTIFSFVLLVSCSIEQNTITADIYHDLTAHFNGYFYAREKAEEVEKAILKSLDDDPNQVLLLFPRLDTNLAKTYAKDTEEIIKMSSISIQRHPNSRWVYENYIMVGRARLYDCDFPDAIQTFKYVNTKSKDANLRHQALVYLVRTFTEHEDFDKAEEAFMFLEKEALNKTNRKDLLLEKAHYYQVRHDYDNMVRNLTGADSLLTTADRKARIYFIIGQVYQQLGFGAEAYNYYRKCLTTNPEYEIDFYARLNMAQVARLDNVRDVKTIRRQFDKLLADAKNVEFRDKIYYELGEFERKQNHIDEAIANYKLAAHAGTNKRIQGSAFLKVGQLYFDSLKKYDLAKFYYDSAVAALPREFENYQAIIKRQEVLGDFVKYTQAIRWQDSLLVMSNLDSAQLRKALDSTLTSRNKPPDNNGKRRRARRSTGGASTGSNSILFQTESTATSTWYYGNPSAVALGESEFQRIWGNRPLEDNWRRSNKSAVIREDLQVTEAETKSTETEATAEKANPIEAEVNRVFAEIPRTDEEKAAALAKIEESYFMLGDLYFIRLNERSNAAHNYEQLITRFPDSEHAAEVLYKLYLIEKDKTDGKPDYYANLLQTRHPNSTFTKVMLNPDFLKETSVAAEKQKLLYKDAYTAYAGGNLRSAQELTAEALTLGQTSFTPQLELLRILIMGKTEDVTKYQYELQAYIGKYPDGPVTPYAQELLAASKTFLDKIEKSKGIRFAHEPGEQHYVIILYRIADRLTDIVSGEAEAFNQSIRNRKLETTNLVFNDDMALTMITDFADRQEAQEYLARLSTWLAQRGKLTTHNFDNFVITKSNFQIFYRTKALDEYLTFYDRNYKGQNQ
jgi:tetratricopeptide (TPR) repeat protein